MPAVTLLSLNVYVVVPLLLASDAGSYFDFAAFSFQVPANDSVPCAATALGRAAVMSRRLISATRRCVDMRSLSVELVRRRRGVMHGRRRSRSVEDGQIVVRSRMDRTSRRS